MKVAITGGTGFIGGHLARALAAQGVQTVLISRGIDDRNPELRQLPSTTFAAIGLDSVDALTQAFQGCDSVVHCAGINREHGQQTYQKVHVKGTENVVEAACRADVKKVVLISFLRARPNCGSGYHESKWAAEKIVTGSGLDYTIIKEGITYGKGDHMITALSAIVEHLPVFGAVGFRPKPLRPVAVTDLVKILIAAAVGNRLSRETIAVVGPEEISLKQAINRVANAVDSRVISVPLPLWMHYALGGVCEKLMKVPLISKAQVQILAEGLTHPEPAASFPPDDLAPRTPFGREQIVAALP